MRKREEEEPYGKAQWTYHLSAVDLDLKHVFCVVCVPGQFGSIPSESTPIISEAVT